MLLWFKLKHAKIHSFLVRVHKVILPLLQLSAIMKLIGAIINIISQCFTTDQVMRSISSIGALLERAIQLIGGSLLISYFFLCAETRSERYDAICLFIQLSRHCSFSFLSSSIATKYPPFLSSSFLGQTQMHKSGLLGIGTYCQFNSIPPHQIISKVKIRMVFQIAVTDMIY